MMKNTRQRFFFSLPPFLRALRQRLFPLFLTLIPIDAIAQTDPASAADTLPAAVENALRAAGISRENVSVIVRQVGGDKPLIAVNADKSRNPASVMKLVTSYAALDLLGPDFRWETGVFADAPVVEGVLEGRLFFRGSGDPRLALEQFGLLLRQLRARGLKDIRGPLVLDRGAYALPDHDPAAFDRKPLRPYNVGPNALLVNFQSLTLTLHHNAAEQSAQVFVETPYDPLRVDNRIQLAAHGACGDWRERIQISVRDADIRLSGDYPASCGDKHLYLSPWPANEQFERLFRALWSELGGTWIGALQVGTTPDGAQKLATHRSPPLAEALRDANKYSSNVMARQVFLSLSPAPATPQGARTQVAAWLERKKLALPSLVLDNGSGLSRAERISARDLSRLLLSAWDSPVMPELISSLPIAGVDGTLKKRAYLAAHGRAHLKTGSLEGARSLAGYALDALNRRWIVVFIINDPNAGAGGDAIDALIEWIAG